MVLAKIWILSRDYLTAVFYNVKIRHKLLGWRLYSHFISDVEGK